MREREGEGERARGGDMTQSEGHCELFPVDKLLGLLLAVPRTVDTKEILRYV